MGVLTADRELESTHIRPFRLTRDLPALADLVEVCFEDDLRRTGSPIVAEIRQMATLGSGLYLLALLGSPYRGIVWEEGGRLLGNVTITREHGRVWSLSNVAVVPEARGRRIGSALLDQAIQRLRDWGASEIILQVRPAGDALFPSTLEPWSEVLSGEQGRAPGLAEKNRRAVAAFDDARVLADLLALPQQLLDQAVAEAPLQPRQLRRAQIAVAIQLLLAVPLQLHQLAVLRIGRERRIERPPAVRNAGGGSEQPPGGDEVERDEPRARSERKGDTEQRRRQRETLRGPRCQPPAEEQHGCDHDDRDGRQDSRALHPPQQACRHPGSLLGERLGLQLRVLFLGDGPGVEQ